MLKFGSKSDINGSCKCTVRLLDDIEVLECEFQPHHKGNFLLDYVCKQLNVADKDYFGLRYVDITKQRHWLDLEKEVLKQIKDMDPILFSFRVKFYPPNPVTLKDEITRYQIYLQLKRDLLHGRLYCSQNEAALLGAFIVQAEVGDYDSEICGDSYVSELKLLLKQTRAIEEKIIEIHQTQLKGQSPSVMETHFLKKACQLDTYGVDPHPVKDQKGSSLYLGINHLGILTFHGIRKIKHFNWSEIQKINYERKMFIIHLVYYEKKRTVGFKCPTSAACRFVWRCAVEQMLFFTLQKSADAPVMTGGGLFSWGRKFKYSGRTEKEILQNSRSGRDEELELNGSGSLNRRASSVPATPSTPAGSDLVEVDRGAQEKAQTGRSSLTLENGLGMFFDRGVRDMNGSNEYYFRDSFDRSSCDSQQQDTVPKTGLPLSHRSGRSHSPQNAYRMKREGSKTSWQTAGSIQGAPTSSPSVNQPKETLQPGENASMTKFNFLQVFIPSFLFVAISLITGTILILESDAELLSNVRGLPEMITLKKHYYEPLKEFIARRLFKFAFKT